MSDDPTLHAIDVIAHQVAAIRIVRAWSSDPLYREIGKADWVTVQARAQAIAVELLPGAETYDGAYDHLAARAKNEQP